MFHAFSAARRAARFAWYKSGLFWRTFFLLSVLTALSMGSWIGMLNVYQRGPQVEQTAELVVSVVTITKAALTHSAPDLRRELLFELVSNEGIRIFTLEDSDVVEPPPNNPLMPEIAAKVREKLGKDTRFSSRVNGVAGFWISFTIEDDKYWLMLERERLAGLTRVQWLGWATLVGLLSLVGAALISSLVNLPLARLTAAARAIAKGERPTPLPEKGSQEIIEAHRSFNQMDAIIGQFLDYAKPTDAATFVAVNLSEMLADVGREAARIRDLRVKTDLMPGVHVLGNATDLRRVFNNIIENARRYGKTPGADYTEITILLRVKSTAHGRCAVVDICDHGVGVPEDQIAQLLKPFTRLDTARGQANGAGLGLAIVERVLTRHNAQLTVRNRDEGGLLLQIALPLAG